MKRFSSVLGATLVALGFMLVPASGRDLSSPADENLFVMGGSFASDYFPMS